MPKYKLQSNNYCSDFFIIKQSDIDQMLREIYR